MLKLINADAGDYRLNITFQEKDYSYIARRISFAIGEELWFIWANNNRMLQVIYNTACKELREDMLPGQPASIPEDFLKVLEHVFKGTRNEIGK